MSQLKYVSRKDNKDERRYLFCYLSMKTFILTPSTNLYCFIKSIFGPDNSKILPYIVYTLVELRLILFYIDLIQFHRSYFDSQILFVPQKCMYFVLITNSVSQKCMCFCFDSQIHFTKLSSKYI